MRLLLTLVLVGVTVIAVSAKKHLEDNLDTVPGESKEQAVKKYAKEFQKSHHHSHKHKKNNVPEEQPKESLKPKSAPVDIPEPEIQLQENVETSKKAMEERKRKEQIEDLHLQDLTYEENLNKEKKKKKGHHGAHQAEIIGKEERNEKKLFAEHNAKKSVDAKVIEDSFEPLKNQEGGKKNKGKKDKKSKDKTKNKKAFEKNKDKSRKSKDGKNKNKDKKHKNKDSKKW